MHLILYGAESVVIFQFFRKCCVYIINMIDYFLQKNSFGFDKDKYNITSTLQIGYQK